MATGSDAVPELSTVRVRMGIVGHRRGMDRLMGVAGFGLSSLLRESHQRRMAHAH